MEPRVELSQDERDALSLSISKIVALRKQIEDIAINIEPFLVLIAKNHGLEPSLYVLSDDGSALVLRN